jgi:hypothetical protein
MSQPRFDPYAILQELDRVNTGFVLIGGLARVIQGSDELTRGLDISPSLNKESLRRLGRALESLNARRVDGQPLDVTDLDPQREPVIELTSDFGEIKIVPEPAGTRGYEDLRFRANRERLGHGVSPSVASPATSSACWKRPNGSPTRSYSRRCDAYSTSNEASPSSGEGPRGARASMSERDEL